MTNLSYKTCCFSGYRIEKMPFESNDAESIAALCAQIKEAVVGAAAMGYSRFFTGMSTGFDLWAAETVLQLQERLSIDLLCAVPFEQQAHTFSPEWKEKYERTLREATEVFQLSPHYYAGCYAVRNKFMIDASSMLICYYDGRAGGTAQTVRMARQKGLQIRNLADRQITML